MKIHNILFNRKQIIWNWGILDQGVSWERKHYGIWVTLFMLMMVIKDGGGVATPAHVNSCKWRLGILMSISGGIRWRMRPVAQSIYYLSIFCEERARNFARKQEVRLRATSIEWGVPREFYQASVRVTSPHLLRSREYNYLSL